MHSAIHLRRHKGSNKVAIKTNTSVVLRCSLWDFIWNLLTWSPPTQLSVLTTYVILHFRALEAIWTLNFVVSSSSPKGFVVGKGKSREVRGVAVWLMWSTETTLMTLEPGPVWCHAVSDWPWEENLISEGHNAPKCECVAPPHAALQPSSARQLRAWVLWSTKLICLCWARTMWITAWSCDPTFHKPRCMEGSSFLYLTAVVSWLCWQ